MPSRQEEANFTLAAPVDQTALRRLAVKGYATRVAGEPGDPRELHVTGEYMEDGAKVDVEAIEKKLKRVLEEEGIGVL